MDEEPSNVSYFGLAFGLVNMGRENLYHFLLSALDQL